MTEDMFGGLRFVRNRMGYDADHADFVQPLDPGPGAAAPHSPPGPGDRCPSPRFPSLTERGREWELTRYRAYQAELAGHPVGETFTQATAFLRLVAEGSSSAARSARRPGPHVGLNPFSAGSCANLYTSVGKGIAGLVKEVRARRYLGGGA